MAGERPELNNVCRAAVDQRDSIHNARLIPPCIIGKNVSIENCTIGPNVTIGNNCKLKNLTMGQRRNRMIIPGYVEPRVQCQRARVPKKESRPS
ncbi:hypothetical protein [Fibrobacter sp.]